jgi:hypothetical protein
MRPFTEEAAEQVISLLCYSRTEDRYYYGPRGKIAAGAGAFRLAVTVNEGKPRLVLSDIYDPARFRTITIGAAMKQGLLDPSWEDLVVKLYLNDQDILYMCLMSREEPVRSRFNEIVRVKAYRDGHIDRAKAVKFTYMPRRLNDHIRSIPRNSGGGPGKRGVTGAHLHKRARAS